MPVYEYYCNYCQNVTELLSSIDNRPKSTECTTCGKEAPRSVLSAPNVLLSGEEKKLKGSKYYGVTNPVTGEGLKPKGKI